MLAVQQRPQAMASGRDADPHQNPLPFGYFVEEFPFQNAPEPPHGAPLLSDHENKALDSFFEDMTADSAMFGTASTPADGLVYSDAWLDLPPQFMGSTSFFGHTPDPFRASPDLHDFLPSAFPDMTSLSPSFAMLPPPPPLPQQQQQQQPPPSSQNIPRTPSLAASSFSPSRPTSSSPVAPAALSATAARHASPLLGSGLSAAEQQPSADVLEAASVLQNGSLGSRSEPGLHFGNSSSSSSGSASSTAFVHPHNPFLSSSQNDTTAAQILSFASRSASTSTTSPSALFSPPEAATATATATDATTGARRTLSFSSSTKALHNPRTELLWGSDQSFNHVQFTPRSARETSEALVNQHLKSMQCLEVNHSADSTRPSSPAAATSFDAALVPLHLKTRTVSMAAEKPNGTKVARTAPPRKRRKGKAAVKVEEAEHDVLDLDSDGLDGYQANGHGDGDGANNRNGNGDDDDDNDNNGGGGDGDVTTNGKGNKPRKRKAAKASTNGHLPLSPSAAAMTSPRDTLSGSPTAFGRSGSANGDGHGDESAAGQQRRRRRSAAQAKPPRENLTEDQKRENHIKSEQKRRTLIKSGFDDLCDLVPSLHGGGFSKSVMLTMAADWLEELLRGNEVLREQLQRTGG